MVYTAERTKKDLADKLTAEQTGKIDTAVAALKDALAKGDMTVVKTKTDELSKVLQDVGTVIYQQAAAASSGTAASTGRATRTAWTPGTTARGTSGPSEEKVVDSAKTTK